MVNQQFGVKETEQFWSKTWKQKEHCRNAEWNMKKNLKKARDEHIPGVTKSNTQENAKLENTMVYMDSGLKNSHLSPID